jgi:hypothetical protein
VTKLNSVEADRPDRPLARATITISQDAARQGPIGHQVLYVLGFGLAGAILANAVVFIYFTSFYSAG